MNDIDCDDDLAKYHAEHVTLLEWQRKRMRKHRKAGEKRLDRGLDRDGFPKPYLKRTQGSYAMRTMHQNSENEYDIDQGIYFRPDDLRDDDDKILTPRKVRERIATALRDKQLKYEAEVKANCVRQLYDAGYHIDMPIYRVTPADDDAGNETVELAASDEWVVSDARAVTRWFEDERARLCQQAQTKGAQMSQIVRLTKKFARSRTAWKANTTSGICITRLVVDHFAWFDERLDVALRQTWRAIDGALVDSTQIDHPVDLDTHLAEDGDEEVVFFHSKLSWALGVLNGLDADDVSLAEARRCWDKVFDTDFFTGRPDPDDNGRSGPSGSTLFAPTGQNESRRRTDKRFG